MLKEKLAKNSSLKMGLSMGVSDKKQSFEAVDNQKQIQNEKRYARLKANREAKKDDQQQSQKEKEGEEKKPGGATVKKEP